jgi:thiamine biosynthesis protein ThiI
MKKIIMIKYGELTTKKDNINLFISTLNKNIKEKLSKFSITTNYDKGRLFINVLDEKYDEVIAALQEVFGIHEIIVGYELDTLELEAIENNLLDLLKGREFKTFKVETKRSNKTIPLTSVEISSRIGGYLLKNIPNLKVDIHNPEIVIHLELRSKESYIYFEAIKGLGGYPVGTLGKGILMLSGGIDSPVAGYMAIKRGVKLECLYFESPPHTSIEAKNKVKELAKILSKYNNDIKLHVINFTEIQETIYKNIPHEYLITIMRRMMYRIGESLAIRSNAKILVNGESIGQVASQTLTSMKAINEVVKIPVIRPVACFDKLEIIAYAKKIKTYETSILPYEDCCTIFVPDHPVINPDIKSCHEYEKLIPYEDLIYKAIKNHEVIKITSEEKNDYEDIL